MEKQKQFLKAPPPPLTPPPPKPIYSQMVNSVNDITNSTMVNPFTFKYWKTPEINYTNNLELQITVQGLKRPWDEKTQGHPMNVTQNDLTYYTLNIIFEHGKHKITCTFCGETVILALFDELIDAQRALKQYMKHAMRGKLYFLLPKSRQPPPSPPTPPLSPMTPPDLDDINEDEIFNMTPVE